VPARWSRFVVSAIRATRRVADADLPRHRGRRRPVGHLGEHCGQLAAPDARNTRDDQQHAWVMTGDERGMYGEYPVLPI
jgi:hypothetical protein